MTHTTFSLSWSYFIDMIPSREQSCAKNPWVPLDGTPIYGVRPIDETPSAPSTDVQQIQYADSPIESSIYTPSVKGVVEISQTNINEYDNAPASEALEPSTFVPDAVQEIRQEEPVQAVSYDASLEQPVDQAVSYFIPAPTTIPEGQEDSLLLSQPGADPTNAPFIPAPAVQEEQSFITAPAVQQEPSYITAPPSESITYSNFAADQQESAVPIGVQEQIQEQQASILSNFEDEQKVASPAAAVAEETPQQVAVFFSDPAQQVVSAPTFEYLPPLPSA